MTRRLLPILLLALTPTLGLVPPAAGAAPRAAVPAAGPSGTGRPAPDPAAGDPAGPAGARRTAEPYPSAEPYP
ncbi:hypothetical protein ACFRKE_30685, partial [Kitasatospora indigofera]